MSKADKLKKEAKEYTDKLLEDWELYDPEELQEAYIAGAEPREKRIEELEKENAGLKARLNAINLLTPELEKSSKLKTQQLTKAKYTLKKIIETVQNDRINEYGARLVLIKDFASECLQEIEK